MPKTRPQNAQARPKNYVMPIASTPAVNHLQTNGSLFSSSAFQASCCGFESRLPLITLKNEVSQNAQAHKQMHKQFYTAEEAAEVLGINRTSVIRRIQSGSLFAVKQGQSKTAQWLIPATSLFPTASPVTEQGRLDALLLKWEAEQRNGRHTGKPSTEGTIKVNHYGLRLYWRFLNQPALVENIQPERVIEAITAIPIDREARNDHATMKELMYKGVLSFYKLLVREGLRDKEDLHKLAESKPRRVYAPRKTVLTEPEFKKLLAANREQRNGRSRYNIELDRAMIFMLGFAGLRRNELRDLKLRNVSLEKGTIEIIDGKGNKDRVIGIMPELAEAIERYLEHRPRGALNLLLVEKGSPVAERVINRHIKNAGERAGLDITPHGLRRTCATLLANRGMPPTLIQMVLGHSDFKTTQGYIMHSQSEMIEWMRQGGRRE